MRRYPVSGWYKYVILSMVGEYEAAGWITVSDLGKPHGEYSVLMQWTGDGDPVMPTKKVSHGTAK